MTPLALLCYLLLGFIGLIPLSALALAFYALAPGLRIAFTEIMRKWVIGTLEGKD